MFRSAVPAILLACIAPGAAGCQEVQVAVGYTASGLTSDGWSPLLGPQVGATFRTGAGWRLAVAHTRGRQDGPVLGGYCGETECFVGPLDTEWSLESFGVEVDRSVLRRASGELWVSARWSRFGQRLSRTRSGDEQSLTDTRLHTWGLGLGVAYTVAPGSRLSPEARLAVDRLAAMECLADAACYGTQYRAEAGLRVHLRIFGG